MVSRLVTTIEVPEEVVKEEFERVKRIYRRQLANMLRSFIAGAINKYQYDYGVEVVQEMSMKTLETGVEINLRVYIDEESLAELKRKIEEQLRDKRITTLVWTSALKEIKGGQMKSSSGELDALLPNSAQRSTEALGEVGGDRAKIRSEERRPDNEGDSEADKRGVHVTEE
jgi:hypothetical protein